MKMLSVGPIEGNVATFRTKLEQAVSKWDGPAKLAVLYLPFTCDHEKFLDVASRVLHAPVVGATTGGVAFTERGHSNTGAVCAVFGGEDFDADCALAINVRSNPLFHIGHALRSMDLKSGRHTSVLVLADAFACDGEVLVSAIRDNVPPHCKFFGGTAGDDWGFKGSKVFIDGKAMSNAAVFVALHPQQRVNVDVLHGWTMAEGSREFTITSIDGNILRRLDDRPAVDVYRDELRRLGLLSDAESLIAVLAKYELGARTPFGEQLKLRAPRRGTCRAACSAPRRAPRARSCSTAPRGCSSSASATAIRCAPSTAAARTRWWGWPATARSRSSAAASRDSTTRRPSWWVGRARGRGDRAPAIGPRSQLFRVTGPSDTRSSRARAWSIRSNSGLPRNRPWIRWVVIQRVSFWRGPILY